MYQKIYNYNHILKKKLLLKYIIKVIKNCTIKLFTKTIYLKAQKESKKQLLYKSV